jgi:hypothetical protein
VRATRRAHHGERSGARARSARSIFERPGNVASRAKTLGVAAGMDAMGSFGLRTSGCITTQAGPDQTQFPVTAGARTHAFDRVTGTAGVRNFLGAPSAVAPLVLRARQIWVSNPFDENTHVGENGRGMEELPPPTAFSEPVPVPATPNLVQPR